MIYHYNNAIITKPYKFKYCNRICKKLPINVMYWV